ncbi:MAG: Nramp family divalent metal transporter [Planctomycetaceae bacterium]|nr:Nramp family divalent metal transporter [Planctomycetaceae bacterium]
MPLFAPLEDFQQADLPPRTKSFWQMAGPGAVLVGLSIGAGEIIIWPTTIAKHGAGMAWAAVVGVLLQIWINLEVARWTVATGETVYTGYSRLWRGFGPLFILLTILGWLAPGWAQASGSALKALFVGPDFGAGTFWGSNTCWTTVTFAAVVGLLFGPKLVYQSVEKTIEILVLIVTLGLILVALFVGTADTWKDLGRGIVNVGYRDPAFPVKDLFIAIVFAGAGGTANLFYTFYLRDKNIGMGSLIPDLQNPLRGRTETIPSAGFRFPDTDENRRRFRGWWRYIWQDQLLFFWFLNTFTLLLFIYGALAVLRPRGIVPERGSLIWDESVILAEVFGRWGAGWGQAGRVVFLMVGVATLFSTQLAVVDGVARSIADILHTNFAVARKRELSWWYMVIALVWIAIGILITAVLERFKLSELGVLFNAAYMGGFAMAIYVPLTLIMNLKYLPKSARPGPVHISMMVLASLVYGGFAIMCLWSEVAARL